MRFLLSLYNFLSPFRTTLYTTLGVLPHPCRHQPSCSQYTKDAIIKYGTITGLWRGLKRFSTCHPFYPTHN